MGDYHTYITGQTRMGKSTLLTILFHRYIQRTNSNVILFDVHGDLANKAKMINLMLHQLTCLNLMIKVKKIYLKWQMLF